MARHSHEMSASRPPVPPALGPEREGEVSQPRSARVLVPAQYEHDAAQGLV